MDMHIVTDVAVESKPQTTAGTTLVVTTYDDAFKDWLMRQDLSDRTVRLYMTAMQDFAAWFKRRHDLELSPEQITDLDVKWYRDYLALERRFKPNSVNSYLAALRAYGRWAVKTKLIYENPGQEIKGIKVSDLNRRPKWLTLKEQQDLLGAAKREVNHALNESRGDKSTPACMRAYRDLAIVELGLNSGLRLAEITALDVADVVIRERSGSIEVRMGKGRKARTVPFNLEGRQAVAAWLEVRALAVGEQKVDALFISQKGHARLTARAVSRSIERLGTRGGIVDMTPHRLRHSYGKNLLLAGKSLEMVRMLMGHESIATTALYTMPSDEELQAAAESVSRAE